MKLDRNFIWVIIYFKVFKGFNKRIIRFFKIDNINIWVRKFFVGGGCFMYCELFNSKFSFYLLDIGII